ncbi:MAG: hypothetical protein WBA07_03845 [Rivularia sp. (in: cyanobacteria)]
MSELHLQDKFLLPFFRQELGYQEVKANTIHYSKNALEKEIIYYNFIERDVYVVKGKKELKNELGHLISPRPKQKFGTDKILTKID